MGPTPQRPADNVNTGALHALSSPHAADGRCNPTEWADYTTAQVATGSEKTSEVGTEQVTAPAKAGDRVTVRSPYASSPPDSELTHWDTW